MTATVVSRERRGKRVDSAIRETLAAKRLSLQGVPVLDLDGVMSQGVRRAAVGRVAKSSRISSTLTYRRANRWESYGAIASPGVILRRVPFGLLIRRL